MSDVLSAPLIKVLIGIIGVGWPLLCGGCVECRGYIPFFFISLYNDNKASPLLLSATLAFQFNIISLQLIRFLVSLGNLVLLWTRSVLSCRSIPKGGTQGHRYRIPHSHQVAQPQRGAAATISYLPPDCWAPHPLMTSCVFCHAGKHFYSHLWMHTPFSGPTQGRFVPLQCFLIPSRLLMPSSHG